MAPSEQARSVNVGMCVILIIRDLWNEQRQAVLDTTDSQTAAVGEFIKYSHVKFTSTQANHSAQINKVVIVCSSQQWTGTGSGMSVI